MTAPSVDFDITTVTQVVNALTQAGLSTHDKLVITGQFLSAQAGEERRIFSYSEPLAATEPACAPTFVRAFAHVDWVDGESVVQAGESSVEDGFNKRFHAIERDLDALGADAAKAFDCLAEVRGALQKLLEEVRTELNRLNADVFECCKRGGGRPPVLTFPAPGGGSVLTGTQFLGNVDVSGRAMQLWQTEAGTIMLPNQPTSTAGDPWNDPRVLRSAELARTIAANKAIDAMFTDNKAVTKEAIVKQLGNTLTPNGMRLGDLLAILPTGTRFASSADLLRDVTEREAAALRTSGTVDAALTAAFGLGTDVATIADAPVERFGAIPVAQRQALIKAGITTLGALAAKQPSDLAYIVKKAGVSAPASEIAAWHTTADALLKTK